MSIKRGPCAWTLLEEALNTDNTMSLVRNIYDDAKKFQISPAMSATTATCDTMRMVRDIYDDDETSTPAMSATTVALEANSRTKTEVCTNCSMYVNCEKLLHVNLHNMDTISLTDPTMRILMAGAPIKDGGVMQDTWQNGNNN